MWPQIDIGLFVVDGFMTMRVAAIIVAAFVFWWQWLHAAQLGLRRWKEALLVLAVMLASGVAGTRLWELLRTEVIGAFWVGAFRLSQVSSWYFAGLITTLLGAALALRLVCVPVVK